MTDWLDKVAARPTPAIKSRVQRQSALERLRSIEAELLDMEATQGEKEVLRTLVIPGVRYAITALVIADQVRLAWTKVCQYLVAAKASLLNVHNAVRLGVVVLAARVLADTMANIDGVVSLVDRFLGLL